MLDIDKDWIPVILALITAVVTPTVIGIGWWFKSKREDLKAERERHRAELERLCAIIASQEIKEEKLQQKIENLLMDSIARERENSQQNRERLDMDAKQIAVVSAATAALKESAAAITVIKETSGE